MNHVITWFEIPAQNVSRAAKFYEEVLQRKIHQQNLSGVDHAFFDHTNGEIAGAIVKETGLNPGKEGVLIYFNCNNQMEDFLSRVEPAGGKIEKHKTLIAPEVGYMAIFIDTEGNRVAFYSRD